MLPLDIAGPLVLWLAVTAIIYLVLVIYNRSDRGKK